MNNVDWKKLGWTRVGQAGVDSGQMMLVDPSYVLSKTKYNELLNMWNKSQNGSISLGLGKYARAVVCHTWIGDGNYHVYVQKDNKGRVMRMMIDFMVSYGFDENNKELHDIPMEELIEKVWSKGEP